MSKLYLTVEYKGYDETMDKQISKILGKRICSSGFFMADGIRDLQFSFRTIPELIRGKKTLQKFKGFPITIKET